MRTRDTSIYPISFCHIGIILFLMSLFSCSVPDRLEIALQFAGDNRPELEKVLVHYKDDSLKLHAARFLIENMPSNYSLWGDELDSIYVALSQYSDSGKYDNRYDYLKKYAFNNLHRQNDAKNIKSYYLI